jgi:hypothetical protein
MPTQTYTPLANLTLSSSAASVTFSSISQAYRDLVIVAEFNSASGNAYPALVINSLTGAYYSGVIMGGDGTTASSSVKTTGGSFPQTIMELTETANANTTEKMNMILSIMDYSTTDKHKSVLFRGNRAGAKVEVSAHRFESTSSVTTVLVRPQGSTLFASGSTFALYGIAA